jgi:hypothetical protein
MANALQPQLKRRQLEGPDFRSGSQHPGAVALPRQRPARDLSELGSGDNRGDEQHHPADLQAAAVG